MPRPPADDVLIAGPYRPPRIRVGNTLYCERFGEVVVTGFTERMRWLCTIRQGQQTPILCGDLVRAVRTESMFAVTAWWEVSRHLAWRWRRCLGVGRKTPGTLRLRKRCTFTAEERVRSAEAARSRKGRRRRSRTAKERWLRDKCIGPFRLWAVKDIRLLGTDSDTKIARKTGRTVAAVAMKRRELGIVAARYRK
mgnify:CR=1 FL=1